MYVGTSGRGIYVRVGTYGSRRGRKERPVESGSPVVRGGTPFGTQRCPKWNSCGRETRSTSAPKRLRRPGGFVLQSVPGWWLPVPTVRRYRPVARVPVPCPTCRLPPPHAASFGSTDRLTLQGHRFHTSRPAPAELVQCSGPRRSVSSSDHDDGTGLPRRRCPMPLNSTRIYHGAHDLTVRLETATGSWAERTGRWCHKDWVSGCQQ